MSSDYFQVDLDTSQSMETIYMYQYLTNNAAPQIEIYVGETSASIDSYVTSNTKCHTGNSEGLVDCKATGRYIIFRNLVVNGNFRFGELFAWNQKLVQVSNVNIVSGLDPSSSTDVTRLAGNTDSSKACISFNIVD